jgi:holo-[acyl-carrier protein] synthase
MASAPGIGVDVLEIGRLERAIERHPRLRERIFRPAELAIADGHRRPAARLATRFCAKEATLKTLGLSAMRMRDVEVVGGGSTVPTLLLHGAAAERARAADLELAVSLSHERDVAVAVVSAARRR